MMPERQIIRTYPSDSVMGEDSYVKIRGLTMGQQKKISKDSELPEEAKAGLSEEQIAKKQRELAMEKSAEIIQKVVWEWNWVDEDGKPLPLPKDDPDVLDELTEAEIRFLTAAMKGDVENGAIKSG
jgi:hypothetical protein